MKHAFDSFLLQPRTQSSLADAVARLDRLIEQCAAEEKLAERLRAAAAERDELLAANAKLREALKLWMSYGCPACSGDCAGANPNVTNCPVLAARAALGRKP